MSKYRNAYCSFCRKSYQDVGPLVEGPGDVYICPECIELCQSIIDQESVRRSSGNLSHVLRSAAGHMIQSVESASWSWDPRMANRLTPADRPNTERLLSLADVCQSAALLGAVSELLKNIKSRGLQAVEACLLEDIEMKVYQLQAALNGRADQEAFP